MAGETTGKNKFLPLEGFPPYASQSKSFLIIIIIIMLIEGTHVIHNRDTSKVISTISHNYRSLWVDGASSATQLMCNEAK